jgi:hypothetical protein
MTLSLSLSLWVIPCRMIEDQEYLRRDALILLAEGGCGAWKSQWMPLVLAWLRFNGREGRNGVHAEGRACILATMMTVEETSSLYDEVRSAYPWCVVKPNVFCCALCTLRVSPLWGVE